MKLQLGQSYTVTVVKLIRTGIIVQVGDDSTDTVFIHLSKIANKFISDPSDYVKIGAKYIAEAVVGKIQPVELSLLKLNLQSSSYQESVQVVKPSSQTLDDMIKRMNKEHESKMKDVNTRLRKKGAKR